jgi:hypothetical protein
MLMPPFLHVSMSPCLHVPMTPCLCLHASMSPSQCLYVSMSPCPCLHVSANGKRNEPKTTTSVCFLQTANFRLFAANWKRKFVFSLVGKRCTIIDNSISANVPIYAKELHYRLSSDFKKKGEMTKSTKEQFRVEFRQWPRQRDDGYDTCRPTFVIFVHSFWLTFYAVEMLLFAS